MEQNHRMHHKYVNHLRRKRLTKNGLIGAYLSNGVGMVDGRWVSFISVLMSFGNVGSLLFMLI
jgi:hypothetical protein